MDVIMELYKGKFGYRDKCGYRVDQDIVAKSGIEFLVHAPVSPIFGCTVDRNAVPKDGIEFIVTIEWIAHSLCRPCAYARHNSVAHYNLSKVSVFGILGMTVWITSFSCSSRY